MHRNSTILKFEFQFSLTDGVEVFICSVLFWSLGDRNAHQKLAALFRKFNSVWSFAVNLIQHESQTILLDCLLRVKRSLASDMCLLLPHFKIHRDTSMSSRSIRDTSQPPNQPACITTPSSHHYVHIDCTVLTMRRMRLLTTGAHSTTRLPVFAFLFACHLLLSYCQAISIYAKSLQSIKLWCWSIKWNWMNWFHWGEIGCLHKQS